MCENGWKQTQQAFNNTRAAQKEAGVYELFNRKNKRGTKIFVCSASLKPRSRAATETTSFYKSDDLKNRVVHAVLIRNL